MPYAELTDCRCYYELRGRGRPLLLVPGLGCTTAFWDPVVEDLSSRFQLIMTELRGTGRSEARRHAESLRDYTADLAGLIDHLQLERTCVWGQSLGGIITQRFAADHADRIDRLVLVSCARRFGPYLREMAKLIGQTMRRFPWESYLRAMALLGSGPMFLDENPHMIDEKVQRELAEGTTRGALARQLRCLAKAEEAMQAGDITSPTLVVAGEHDLLIPSCYARQLSRSIPDSRFLLIAGAGHNPPVEMPEATLPPIIEFLETGGIEAVEPPHRIEIGRSAA